MQLSGCLPARLPPSPSALPRFSSALSCRSSYSADDGASLSSGGGGGGGRRERPRLSFRSHAFIHSRDVPTTTTTTIITSPFSTCPTRWHVSLHASRLLPFHPTPAVCSTWLLVLPELIASRSVVSWWCPQVPHTRVHGYHCSLSPPPSTASSSTKRHCRAHTNSGGGCGGPSPASPPFLYIKHSRTLRPACAGRREA